MKNNLSAKNEMIAFSLVEEHYGFHALTLHEVRGYEHVTRYANAPSFVQGVLNLGGAVVPIIDMRTKCALAAPDHGDKAVIIVLKICRKTVGLVVDPADGPIRPESGMDTGTETDYLTGIGLLGERMLVLVEFDCLVSLIDLGTPVHLAA